MNKITTNYKDMWKLISDNSNAVIGEFKTEKELVDHIANEIIYNGKIAAIKDLITFPNGWTVNDKRIPFNDNKEATKAFLDLIGELNNNSDTYEQYYEFIDNKLEELMPSLSLANTVTIMRSENHYHKPVPYTCQGEGCTTQGILDNHKFCPNCGRKIIWDETVYNNYWKNGGNI